MKNISWLVLSLMGLANIHGESWIFSSKKAAKEAFPKDKIVCKEIVDPSYDQTFKMVLSTDEGEQQYLISFLNSIYFPGAEGEDVMIRRIEAIDKENTNLGTDSHRGVTLCDVACKCIYYADHSSSENEGVIRKRSRDEVEEAFDLEMQRAEQEFFTKRLIEYGSNLRRRHNIPTKALGLLNFSMKSNYKDASECYAWCRINPETNQPERLKGEENILETNSIDLRKLVTTEDIYINGKKLDITGITWLKLFAVKQWVKQTGNKRYIIYYPEDKIDENIKGVIEMLAAIKQDVWDEMIRQNAYEKDALNTAKKEGREETVKQIAKVLNLSIEEVQEMLSK